MIRLLKIVLLILLVLLAIPIVAILGVVLKYQSIIRHTPGSLAVNVVAGERGALVDPFIGTGGWPWMGAQNPPGAQTPFGMVRLGPDTETFINGERCLNRSGYYYGEDTLLGFSHTRLVGADSKEGGVFRVLPRIASKVGTIPWQNLREKFSHSDEVAFPGYYAVRLPGQNVLN